MKSRNSRIRVSHGWHSLGFDLNLWSTLKDSIESRVSSKSSLSWEKRLILKKSELRTHGRTMTQQFNRATLFINFARLRRKRLRRLWDSNQHIDSSVNDFSWHCAVTENSSDSWKSRRRAHEASLHSIGVHCYYYFSIQAAWQQHHYECSCPHRLRFSLPLKSIFSRTLLATIAKQLNSAMQ